MKVLSISEATMVAGAGDANLIQIATDAATLGVITATAAVLAAYVIPGGSEKLHEQVSNLGGKLAVGVFGGMVGDKLKDKGAGYNFIQSVLS